MEERDFNSRIPRYNDSSDYTTNAPSYYDDLARKQGLLKALSLRIWEYDKELAKRFEEWDKNLEEFDEEVIKLLEKWIADGTMADIINKVLFNRINNKIDDFGMSVKEFGAKGDGVTDDYKAIMDTIDYVHSKGGGTVYFPFGVYAVSDTIRQTYSNITLKGMERLSIIKPLPSLKLVNDAKWTLLVKPEDNQFVSQEMQNNRVGTGEKARKGHTWVGVKNAYEFEIGDLIYIQGSFSTSPWISDNRGNLVKGEVNLIIDTNTTNNTVRVLKPLSDTWGNDEIADIIKVKPLENVSVDGLSVVAEDDDRYYRGICFQNTLAGTIKNCFTKYCGVFGIESIDSFMNTTEFNHVEDTWIGDIKNSDRSVLGLSYGLRNTQDSLSKTVHNRVIGARHSYDVSGIFPSHGVVFESNTVIINKNEVGNVSTHGTAEGTVIRDNEIINGDSGIINRGVGTIIEGNRSIGTAVSVYDLSFNTIIRDNNFEGHLRLLTPPINDDSIRTVIKGNTIHGQHLAFLVATDDTPYKDVYNFTLEDNTVHTNALVSTPLLNLKYAGDTVNFRGRLSFKNNKMTNSVGTFYNVFIADEDKYVIPRWTTIESDTFVSARQPEKPFIGQTMFHKDHNKPAWFNGTNWVDSTGEILPDDVEG